MPQAFDFTEFEIYQFISVLADERPDFYNYAACKQQGFAAYFPERGQSAKIKKAVATCQFCPVQYECFEYAINTQTEDGVWGGSTPKERSQWIQSGVSVEESWLSLQSKE